MKKFFIILNIMLGLAFIESLAQTEVRGVETKRVIYEGEEYNFGTLSRPEYSNKCYGWEFTNRNSIPVSVEIILHFKGDSNSDPGIEETKDIVLDSGESYIYKGTGYTVRYTGNRKDIELYYITYKAYKLE